MLLLPSLGFSQIVITGSGHITATGTANIVVLGDWTNNASSGGGFTASSGAGELDFAGGAGQEIGGSVTTTFKEFEIDNSDGVTITEDISITDLKFTAGILTTGTNTIHIGDGGSITGAGATAFVDGIIAKTGDDAFTFEVGSGAIYAPIEISAPGSATDIFTAQYFRATPPDNGSFPATLVKISDVEYWDLDRTNGSSTVDVTLHWKNSQTSGIGSDLSKLYFVHHDESGSTWDNAWSGTTSGTGDLNSAKSGSITQSLSSFSFVTFGSDDNVNNPLPIELLSFTAQCQNKEIAINWSTISELNNDYFTLLSSTDAINYEQIAQISAAGNSNTIQNYSFVDRRINNTEVYYMLKQTDYDGQSTSFTPIHTECSELSEVNLKMIYDNNNTYALLSNAQSGSSYNVMIIDHTGRVLIQEKQRVITQNYYRIPKEQLAPGLYSIIYFSDNGSIRLNEKVFIR